MAGRAEFVLGAMFLVLLLVVSWVLSLGWYHWLSLQSGHGGREEWEPTYVHYFTLERNLDIRIHRDQHPEGRRFCFHPLVKDWRENKTKQLDRQIELDNFSFLELWGMEGQLNFSAMNPDSRNMIYGVRSLGIWENFEFSSPPRRNPNLWTNNSHSLCKMCSVWPWAESEFPAHLPPPFLFSIPLTPKWIVVGTL